MSLLGITELSPPNIGSPGWLRDQDLVISLQHGNTEATIVKNRWGTSGSVKLKLLRDFIAMQEAVPDLENNPEWQKLMTWTNLKARR